MGECDWSRTNRLFLREKRRKDYKGEHFNRSHDDGKTRKIVMGTVKVEGER